MAVDPAFEARSVVIHPGEATEVPMSSAQILQLSDCVPEGHWTTYGTIAEIVYGPGRGAQTVGSVLHDEGHVETAHRTLNAGGKVAGLWEGVGGGPEECLRRLRREGTWDESRGRARPDRFIDANALRRLQD
jgi:alkylated DNA nucleotide flippase Atl1